MLIYGVGEKRGLVIRMKEEGVWLYVIWYVVGLLLILCFLFLQKINQNIGVLQNSLLAASNLQGGLEQSLKVYGTLSSICKN